MNVQFFQAMVTLNEVETNRPHAIPFEDAEQAVKAASEFRASEHRRVTVYVWDLESGKFIETAY